MKKYHKLLDIGGASGIYASELCKNNPSLKATVLDLSMVLNSTRLYIKKRGDNKVEVLEGDMFKNSFKGYDAHLYSNVMHDWNSNQIKGLLNKSFKVLSDGGVVLIHDRFLNNKKDGPSSVVDHSLVLALMTDGRCYSKKEMVEQLNNAGFKKIKYLPTTCDYGVFVANK